MPASCLRLFVALELPDAVRQHLASIPAGVTGIGRREWTPMQNLHLTLKFLGDVEADRLPAIIAALHQAGGLPPFDTQAGAFCCFPNPRRARILAAELADESGGLHAMQARIDALCETIGFAKERRAFRAHVTLARGRPTLRADAVADVLHRARTLFPGPRWTVDAFTLMRSTLGGPAPVYEPVGRFDLRPL